MKMTKFSNMFKNITNKKIKKIVFNIIKPFLPFILLILLIFFSMCTLIDAIFIDQVQNNDELKTDVEIELKNACIEKAEYLNTCNNFVGNTSTEFLLDVDNRETDTNIEWSHLYALMAFNNMAFNTTMDFELLEDVSEIFESTYIYEEVSIKVETSLIDKNGNTYIETTEEITYILTESNTIMGHYKYNYETQTVEVDNMSITTKAFISKELLVENKYERLENYLKTELKIDEEDLEYDVQIIIQAANGYYDESENLSWLQEDSFVSSDLSYIANDMFTWPIPGYKTITSSYGMRVHPITGAYSLHTGTDISAPIGTEFVAMAEGVVINAGYNSAYGNMVIIDHRKWNSNFICTSEVKY